MLRIKIVKITFFFHLNTVNVYSRKNRSIYEPRCEKTGLRDFRPGCTITQYG